MSSFVYYNGKICPDSEIKLSFGDRGFLFGDGVFTTLKVNNGVPENLDRHLDRLRKDCLYLKIVPPYLPSSIIEDLIIANQAKEDFWRLKIIFTGGDSKNLNLQERQAGAILVTMTPYKEEILDSYTLCIYPEPVVRPTAKIKSLAYLDRFYIKDFALNKGFSDAVTTDDKGHILEAAFSNIFWVTGKKLYTPHQNLPLLWGISLAVIIEKAKERGLEVIETNSSMQDIPSEAHVFVCNALQGIQSVHAIEERLFPINSNPLYV